MVTTPDPTLVSPGHVIRLADIEGVGIGLQAQAGEKILLAPGKLSSDGGTLVCDPSAGQGSSIMVAKVTFGDGSPGSTLWQCFGPSQADGWSVT